MTPVAQPGRARADSRPQETSRRTRLGFARSEARPEASEKRLHDRVLHTVMHENILATAARLSDDALHARLKHFAGRERDATVELVGHLAELDGRKSHLGEGPGSLYTYCRDVLGYSEDAAWNRAATAGAVRLYPVILGWLADGSLNVTIVRILRPVLTPENHLAVLTEARRRSKKEVEVIAARLNPKPDVPSTIRKLPAPAAVSLPLNATVPQTEDGPAPPPPPVAPAPRPVIAPLTPERYRLQFTVSKETHDKLRRVQDLLCREIPNGDPAAIFERALDLLLHDVEKKKLAATTKPRPPRAQEEWLARCPRACSSRGLEARRRPVRLCRTGRPLHGAAVPRVAPCPAVRPSGAGDGREHLPPVSRPRRLRERAGIRSLRPVHRP